MQFDPRHWPIGPARIDYARSRDTCPVVESYAVGGERGDRRAELPLSRRQSLADQRVESARMDAVIAETERPIAPREPY